MYKQILAKMCAIVGAIIAYTYMTTVCIMDNVTSLGLHQLTDVAQIDSFDQNLPADVV